MLKTVLGNNPSNSATLWVGVSRGVIIRLSLSFPSYACSLLLPALAAWITMHFSYRRREQEAVQQSHPSNYLALTIGSLDSLLTESHCSVAHLRCQAKPRLLIRRLPPALPRPELHIAHSGDLRKAVFEFFYIISGMHSMRLGMFEGRPRHAIQ